MLNLQGSVADASKGFHIVGMYLTAGDGAPKAANLVLSGLEATT